MSKSASIRLEEVCSFGSSKKQASNGNTLGKTVRIMGIWEQEWGGRDFEMQCRSDI